MKAVTRSALTDAIIKTINEHTQVETAAYTVNDVLGALSYVHAIIERALLKLEEMH